MIVSCGTWLKVEVILSPSMADVTEIGGVIIPSASKAAPPIIAAVRAIFADALPKYIMKKYHPHPCYRPLK